MTKSILTLSVIMVIVSGIFSQMPHAEAEDFAIDTSCVNGTWVATVTDSEGSPQMNVKVLVYDSLRTSDRGYTKSLVTDSNGSVSISPDDNQGYVKFSYGGYNEVVMPTACVVPAGTIPGWVRDVAGFWASGAISDNEYSATLTWLANNGIITVEPPKPNCDEMFNSHIIHRVAAIGLEILGIGGDIATQAKHESKVQQELFAGSCSFDSIQLKLLRLVNDIEEEQYNVDSNSCVVFCDSTGYEPQWVKTMGQNQAMQKCWSVAADVDSINTKDWNWCNELAGYIMD